jgi:ElaB/YqjD/DUF883 family membrane-anchored ribosome-binding protein
MPTLLRNIQKGYYNQDSIKRESKDLMAIIESNLKKKNNVAEKEEKPLEGGAKRQLQKFDKKIKSKSKIYDI